MHINSYTTYVNLIIKNNFPMEEIWKPFPNFIIPWTNQHMYEVSNLWRIKSMKFSAPYIITNTNLNSSGYLIFQFTVFKKRHSFLVHRMVMIAFHWESKLTVNHKDGDKTNNILDNLEYCTQKENVQHAFANWLIPDRKWENSHLYKVTWSDHPKSEAILQLNRKWDIIKEWESLSAPKEIHGWNKSHISKAIRMNKLAYGYLWKKVEPTLIA